LHDNIVTGVRVVLDRSLTELAWASSPLSSAQQQQQQQRHDSKDSSDEASPKAKASRVPSSAVVADPDAVTLRLHALPPGDTPGALLLELVPPSTSPANAAARGAVTATGQREPIRLRLEPDTVATLLRDLQLRGAAVSKSADPNLARFRKLNTQWPPDAQAALEAAIRGDRTGVKAAAAAVDAVALQLQGVLVQVC
jgi:hypothetical protein